MTTVRDTYIQGRTSGCVWCLGNCPWKDFVLLLPKKRAMLQMNRPNEVIGWCEAVRDKYGMARVNAETWWNRWEGPKPLWTGWICHRMVGGPDKEYSAGNRDNSRVNRTSGDRRWHEEANENRTIYAACAGGFESVVVGSSMQMSVNGKLEQSQRRLDADVRRNNQTGYKKLRRG